MLRGHHVLAHTATSELSKPCGGHWFIWLKLLAWNVEGLDYTHSRGGSVNVDSSTRKHGMGSRYECRKFGMRSTSIGLGSNQQHRRDVKCQLGTVSLASKIVT